MLRKALLENEFIAEELTRFLESLLRPLVGENLSESPDFIRQNKRVKSANTSKLMKSFLMAEF